MTASNVRNTNQAISIYNEITIILNKLNKNPESTENSPSSVAQNNIYRKLLDEVRADLYQFDGEKKARILFSINKAIHSQNPEDLTRHADLIAVLFRIQEILTKCRDSNVLLTSPLRPSQEEKKSSNNSNN